MTAPSLLIAGIETIDKSINPDVRVATGGASALEGLDFGEGVPDQATIASLYLDGDAVIGRRTGNRLMQIPLNIYGTSPMDIATKIDTIRKAVAVDAFPVQWTPAGGLPVIFDCFRATVQRIHNPNKEAAGRGNLLLTFPAKPFGRSPDLQAVTAEGTSTQLDDFDTAPTGATLVTTTKYEGTGSGRATLTNGQFPSSGTKLGIWAHTTTPVSRSLGSVDLTDATAVTLRLRWSPPQIKVNGGTAQNWTTRLYATLTLTSAAGNVTLPRVTVAKLKSGSTAWNRVTFALTDVGDLDIAAVTGYSVTLETDVTYDHVSSGARAVYTFAASTSSAYFDDLRWVPPSSALTSTTHGANLLLPAIVGSARAPVNLELAAADASVFTAFVLHTPPEDQDIDAQILIPLDGGDIDQTVTIDQPNARFDGTYSVVLGVDTSGGGDVSVTVTIQQYAGVLTVGPATVLTVDYTSGPLVIPVGEITLPLFAVPDDNDATSFTVQVEITGADRFTELMLLDTTGQTVFTDINMINRAALYVDEPDALRSGPSVYGSTTDRTAAVSTIHTCVVSGGPIVFEPGDNKLLAWVSSDVPMVTATYYPRWLDERIA